MQLPETLKGAIFDLDGTLLDSLHVWQDVDRLFFERRNMALPPDYVRAVTALDLMSAAVYTRAAYDLPEPPEALVREWLDLIREEYAERIALKPRAGEFVRKLFGEGLRLGIATSAAPELYVPALERLGLFGCFSSVTETREAPRGKGSPDPYLLAARKLGVAPAECAVFEDIAAGLKSAKEGGFFTVAVFDPHSEEREEELRKYADLFVPSFGAFFA